MAHSRLCWHLEITDISKVNNGVDYFLATDVENFFTLADVWRFLGFKLKRERFGYAGIKGNTNYTLTRM